MSGSDPTVPMESEPRGPSDGDVSPSGYRPQTGGYQGPPPGGVPARDGYEPYPSRFGRNGAGFIGVAVAGALVAGLAVAVGTYVNTVQQPSNPFLQSIGLSIWPWYGRGDVSEFYTLFGIDVGGVVVVTFLLLLAVTRPAPGGRSWLTIFFGTWSVVTVAAVIAHLLGVGASGVETHLGTSEYFRIANHAVMWGFIAGWLPSVFAATANSMRRG